MNIVSSQSQFVPKAAGAFKKLLLSKLTTEIILSYCEKFVSVHTLLFCTETFSQISCYQAVLRVEQLWNLQNASKEIKFAVRKCRNKQNTLAFFKDIILLFI